MPYYGRKRSTFSKAGKKVFRRRRRIRRPSNWKTAAYIAQKAWQGVKFIKGLVNVEKHKFDTSFSIPFAATGTVSSVVSIATGDTEGTRTGNSILAKYLYIWMNITRNSASTTVSDLVRVVVIRDTEQVADTAPGFTDIFESNSPLALINKLNVGRFSILYDKNYNMTSNSPSAQIKQMIPLNFHIRYNGTSSADIEKNGIYVCFITNASSNFPALQGNTRLAYYDN